jgi:hypothetical protein
MQTDDSFLVMPGLDPSIHPQAMRAGSCMDCRIEPGNDREIK